VLWCDKEGVRTLTPTPKHREELAIFTRLTISLLLINCLGLQASTNPFGGFPEDTPQRCHLGKLLQQLELSADQKREIATILKDSRDTVRPQLDAVAEARTAMVAAILAERADEDQVRSRARNLGDTIEDLAVTRYALYGAIRELLDQDQQVTLATATETVGNRLRVVRPMIQAAVDTWIDMHAE
jgi:protein CpxP